MLCFVKMFCGDESALQTHNVLGMVVAPSTSQGVCVLCDIRNKPNAVAFTIERTHRNQDNIMPLANGGRTRLSLRDSIYVGHAATNKSRNPRVVGHGSAK